MLVIVTESVPERLKGYLSRWLVQVRARVFVGNGSGRTREKLWKTACREARTGNLVMIWSVSNESGYDFCTFRTTSRKEKEIDGIKLVTFVQDNCMK